MARKKKAEKKTEEAPKDEKVNKTATTKKAPAKKTAKKAPAKKKSVYGTALELLGKDPDMKKEELVKKLKQKKLDPEASKSAVNTAINSMRACVKQLRANGHMPEVSGE